jgi:hypothetical protein
MWVFLRRKMSAVDYNESLGEYFKREKASGVLV